MAKLDEVVCSWVCSGFYVCISVFTMIYDFSHSKNLLKTFVSDCRAEIVMLTRGVTSSVYFHGFYVCMEASVNRTDISIAFWGSCLLNYFSWITRGKESSKHLSWYNSGSLFWCSINLGFGSYFHLAVLQRELFYKTHVTIKKKA